MTATRVASLWQFVDGVRAAPAKGWWAYTASFQRIRTFVAGGVTWRLDQEIGHYFDIASLVHVGPLRRLPRGRQERLQAAGVLEDIALAIERRGHHGGWRLSPHGLDGTWRADWLSDGEIRSLFHWLDGLPKRPTRPFVRRPRFGSPPRSDRAVAERVWHLVDLFRTSRERARFYSFGIARRTVQKVAGARCRVNRSLLRTTADDRDTVFFGVTPVERMSARSEQTVRTRLREQGGKGSWVTTPGGRFFHAEFGLPRGARLWTDGRALLEGLRLP